MEKTTKRGGGGVKFTLPRPLSIKKLYDETVLAIRLRRSTLKKLIKDTYMKNDSSYDNNVYKQIDGVSMGSSIGPILEIIITTELQKIVASDLINSGLIKLYIRYVGDTLLLPKGDVIENIALQFNAFDDNFQFTIDKFTDSNVLF